MIVKKRIRPIAIYLPQFHPTPDNDEWWGKGFTEWTNVTKARPAKKGHYQPHLPSELGFYDLRVPETREAQADLAKQYGIYGFCYYHYWFNGRRILERPFNEVFESGKPDFPFMLCWANENWTRVWDGGSQNILLEQKYSLEDDLNHIRYLIPIFKDSRYIKIDGKPVFSIYRSDLFPDMKATISLWREEAKKHDIELYLCRFETFGTSDKKYLDAGFDAAIEFQPRFDILQTKVSKSYYAIERLKRILLGEEKGEFYSYPKLVERSLERYNNEVDYKLYRGACPSWDNAARKKQHITYVDSTPELFQYWIENTLQSFTPYSKEENLFFINAWNEWAEGNHLEPDQKWGRAYLEAVKNAMNNLY